MCPDTRNHGSTHYLLYYLFVYIKGRVTKRWGDKDKRNFSFTGLLLKFLLKPELCQIKAKSLELQIIHVSGGDSNTWNIFCCLPDTLAELWMGNRGTRTQIRLSSWHVGIPWCNLPNCTAISQCLLQYSLLKKLSSLLGKKPQLLKN